MPGFPTAGYYCNSWVSVYALKGRFISWPGMIKRFLKDILEWLWSWGRVAGFLPEPKMFEYLPDYLGVGSGAESEAHGLGAFHSMPRKYCAESFRILIP